MRPQKHKEKMLHHIQAAGPLPHSHPSPQCPCLQSPGPPIWAVSAGRSHPQLGVDAAGITPHSRLGLCVWAGAVALACSHLGLCHLWASGFPSGVTGNRVGEGEEALRAHSPPRNSRYRCTE